MTVNLRGSAGPAVLGLIGLVAAAWIYLAAGAGPGPVMRQMSTTGGAMMLMRPAWTPGYGVAVLAMWVVMMAAMMLPSATPIIARVAGLGGVAPATWFAAGYLTLWTGFGAAAAALQWVLDSANLFSDAMAIRSAALAGALVASIGLYQLTPLKHACLGCCRRGDDCFAGGRMEGGLEMAGTGLRYGLSCLGCCAALMGLLFVGGLMNLVWIAAIAAWVFAEKTRPWGARLARPAAAGLITWGTGCARDRRPRLNCTAGTAIQPAAGG